MRYVLRHVVINVYNFSTLCDLTLANIKFSKLKTHILTYSSNKKRNNLYIKVNLFVVV